MTRALLFALTLALAAPAAAQSFEGLDLGTPKKKPPKKPAKKGTATEPKKGTAAEVKKDEAPSSSEPARSAEPARKDEAATPAPAAPALDLTRPATAEPKRDPRAAPTMSFDAVDVSGKTADRQRMEAAIAEFKAESFEPAALAFFEITQDPKLVGLQLEAEYWLGKSLYKLAMYHSALQAFSKVLSRGPGTRYFKSSLEWLFFIARKTVNETVVLDEIAKYSNAEFPERFRTEFRYLLARYNFVRGRALDEADLKGEGDKAFDEVKRIALMVPKGDPFYPRTKYLEGLASFRDNKPEVALEAMKEVVRVTRQVDEGGAGEARNLKALRELAFMQLARTHYGARQNRSAIFYLSKIERGGPQWLEALFEASWAHYRIGQYEQALGNLLTLSSPFFKDEYFPEALILKAVIYYENCRYREAEEIIIDFNRTYGPVREALEALVAKNLEAAEYFNVLDEVRKKNKAGLRLSQTDQTLERILNLALTDKDLKKTVDSIAELEGEIDSLSAKGDSFRYSSLSKALVDQLKVQRGALIKKAGVMAKGKLEFELGALKTLLANGLRIKFEKNTKEVEFLQQVAASGGEMAIVKPYKQTYGVPDEFLYWPYAGEFWRDELGTYQYTLTKGCIERDSANRVREDR
jgi:TolA-binding protein